MNIPTLGAIKHIIGSVNQLGVVIASAHPRRMVRLESTFSVEEEMHPNRRRFGKRLKPEVGETQRLENCSLVR